MVLLYLLSQVVTFSGLKMPNQTSSKRIALSVPPDLDQVLDDLAKLQGIPKTKVILSILSEMSPILFQVRDALEQVKSSADPSSVIKSFGLSVLSQSATATAVLAQEVNSIGIDK
jgi:hypothetical protein